MIDDGHSQEGLFDAIGGAVACRKLAAAFYARVDHDPILKPLYGAGSHHCAIDALGNFFIQLFGGPNEYSRHRYRLSLREAHARFGIGLVERDAWLRNIAEAMRDIRIEEPIRSALIGFFTRASTDMINQPQAFKVAEPPHGDPMILGRTEEGWAVQSALDEIVAAVRAEDAVRAMALAEAPFMQAYLLADRAALVGILALAGCSGVPALAQYVNRVLAA